MKFKEFIKEKAEITFKKLALSAVTYAEELIGGGKGAVKKEIAINFLLSKLPVYLKPFLPLFKKALTELADWVIEKAVQKLQYIQKTTGLLVYLPERKV